MTTTAALEGRLVDSLVVIVATITHGSEFVFLSLFVGLRLVSLCFGLPLSPPLFPPPQFPLRLMILAFL